MKKKFTIFFSLILLILQFCFTSVFAYTDVDYNHWAYDAINKLSEIGALNGYSDGAFKPNQSVTRAEFCKIIAELLGDNAKAQNSINYQDVSRFHWANEYIRKVSIYFGDNQNRFYPDSELIRQDAALAIVNILGKANEKYDAKVLHRFLDEDLISQKYEKYISLVVGYEIMNGNADGTFNPNGSVTRAEICQIIYNVILKSQENKPLLVTSDESYVPYTNRIDPVFSAKNVKIDSSYDNTDASIKPITNTNINIDSNGVITVQPIARGYKDPNIWLNVSLEGSTLHDGGTYTIGKGEYISVTIENPSNVKDFIYYSLAYGSNFQTIVVQKVASSRADITIPEELIGKDVKISIWGASTKDGKGYMTATQVFRFNYTGDLSHRGENYSENYNERLDGRKPDFIVLYEGISIEPESTVDEIKQGHKIIIRSKPVVNIQSINYRWDKDIEYTVVNHATETIEIPNTFANGTSHKLTVRIVDTDGVVYMPRVFNFIINGKSRTMTSE